MILALMAATVLAAPHAHKPTTPQSYPFVGAQVTRDLEDGLTLIGAEVGGHAGRLGIRASLAGGDGVTRTTFDGLYFWCGKPTQRRTAGGRFASGYLPALVPYVGVGVVHDCVELGSAAQTVAPPAPKDPPSVLAGVQGQGKVSLFGELRYTFGSADHATVGVGLRSRF